MFERLPILLVLVHLQSRLKNTYFTCRSRRDFESEMKNIMDDHLAKLYELWEQMGFDDIKIEERRVGSM